MFAVSAIIRKKKRKKALKKEDLALKAIEVGICSQLHAVYPNSIKMVDRKYLTHLKAKAQTSTSVLATSMIQYLKNEIWRINIAGGCAL